jgi:hypothetical protein
LYVSVSIHIPYVSGHVLDVSLEQNFSIRTYPVRFVYLACFSAAVFTAEGMGVVQLLRGRRRPHACKERSTLSKNPPGSMVVHIAEFGRKAGIIIRILLCLRLKGIHRI